MIKKFLALVHIPVNAVKEWTLGAIEADAENGQAKETSKEIYRRKNGGFGE